MSIEVVHPLFRVRRAAGTRRRDNGGCAVGWGRGGRDARAALSGGTALTRDARTLPARCEIQRQVFKPSLRGHVPGTSITGARREEALSVTPSSCSL